METQWERDSRVWNSGGETPAWNVMGSHFVERDGKKGVLFRTWAPHASQVFVVGEFSSWTAGSYPMARQAGTTVWEAFIPGLARFDSYKYAIQTADGHVLLKSDPYAFHFETPPGNASKLYDLGHFRWADKRWLNSRGKQSLRRMPVNIYEIHPMSWRRYADGNCFDYEKLAQELVPYLTEMGYTHVGLMPVAEHQSEGSWGYEISGYFAPTSRMGTPRQLMQFVNEMHKAGLGVIMDWCPASFPKEEHGLYRFDGEDCYGYDVPEWGENVQAFDLSKAEVRAFLISSALYWIDQYHLDGLCVQGVAALLHPGQGDPAVEEDPRGCAFLQELCDTVRQLHPNVRMIAGDAPAERPMITRLPQMGGLGFHLCRNEKWTEDLLYYNGLEQEYRAYHHDRLTFQSLTSFAEKYLLPLSRRELGSGGGTLYARTLGEGAERFAAMRVLLGYVMSYPGKKLSFMGTEIGQKEEWDISRPLDWKLLEEPEHRQFQQYVKELNHFYLENPALWQVDNTREGFQWTVGDDAEHHVAVFRRMDQKDRELLAVFNFSAQPLRGYRVGVGGTAKAYDLVFSSNRREFGGRGGATKDALPCERIPSHGMERSIALTLPPFSAAWYRPAGRQRKKTGNT